MHQTKFLVFFALLIALNSCKDNKKSGNPKVSFGPLVWDIAPDEKFVERKGADSYIAYFIDGNRDTFRVEYGSPGIINRLYVPAVPVFKSSSKERIIREIGRMPTPDQVVFSDYPQEDQDLRIFEKNYWLYDTINGIVSKLVQPKKIGDGVTGIYVPKLKDGMSFSMYSNNLDSAADQKALAMFRTIRYKVEGAASK